MKPIWYFVGLLLLLLGAIIMLTGVISLLNPPQTHKVLSNLHPDIWWGGVMLLGGAALTLANRKRTVQ